MPTPVSPRIFVSHSHSDDAFTERLVDDLIRAGAHAWMDKRDLGAGNFQERINEALDGCEWFVLVLTRAALASPWVRQEVDAANRLKNQKRIRDLVFIQAGPVEHSELPPLWGVFNILDATKDYSAALTRVLKSVPLPPSAVSNPQPAPVAPEPQSAGTTITQIAQTARRGNPIAPELQAAARPIATQAAAARVAPQPTPAASRYPLPHVTARLASLGFRGVNPSGTPAILPPLVSVAAGPFLMGSAESDREASDNEKPQHRVKLAAFQIGKYPVTVAEYALAVRASAVREPPAWGDVTWQAQFQRPDHPVVCVSWQDVTAYVAWLRGVTGEAGWKLPSEAQWEKAARWDAARGVSRIYPWGDTFDKALCNSNRSGIGTTEPVGSYPASDAQRSGASPWGAEDMAGNVWEWTSSLYKPYPYAESDGREDLYSIGSRTLRGGSWGSGIIDVRAAYRNNGGVDGLNSSTGIRLARAALI